MNDGLLSRAEALAAVDRNQNSHAAHQQMTQQLKHDVMYHHGMGGPPQRPLQVRERERDFYDFIIDFFKSPIFDCCCIAICYSAHTTAHINMLICLIACPIIVVSSLDVRDAHFCNPLVINKLLQLLSIQITHKQLNYPPDPILSAASNFRHVSNIALSRDFTQESDRYIV